MTQQSRLYEHKKSGNQYVLLYTAENPNTKEVVAVYIPHPEWDNRDRYWRPLSEFQQKFKIVEKKR